MLATIVRPYLAIFAARFLMLLQYRAAALAGIATQFWFGAIMVMALTAFYGSGRGAPSITLAQAITYIWLGQAFLGLLPWNVDTEIATMMRSGNVAYERLRPVDDRSVAALPFVLGDPVLDRLGLEGTTKILVFTDSRRECERLEIDAATDRTRALICPPSSRRTS